MSEWQGIDDIGNCDDDYILVVRIFTKRCEATS